MSQRLSRRYRHRLSVRTKLYTLGIPLAVLSATLLLATALPYRATQTRLATARTDISAAMALLELGRETTEMVWHGLTLTLTGDLAKLDEIARASSNGNEALERWRTDSRPTREETLVIDGLAENKAEVDALTSRVIEALQQGDRRAAEERFFDELLPYYDDVFDDDLDEIAWRENLDLRGAFIRLSGEAGRTESLFGGRLTARIDHTSSDVAQAQVGVAFMDTITDEAIETVDIVRTGAAAIPEKRSDARRVLDTWTSLQSDHAASEERVGRIADSHRALADIEDRALEKSRKGDPTGAMAIVTGPYEDRLQSLIKGTKELVAGEADDIASTITKVANDAQRINRLLTAFAAGAFVLGGLFVVLIARRISKRLDRLTSAAKLAGSGDLTVRVPVDSPDELGTLATAFNAMAANLDDARKRAESLAGKTVGASEQERSNLASELHDGPVQRLSALGYDLERASLLLAKGDPSAAAAVVDVLKARMSSEVLDLRRMMMELRPPALDETGLGAALRDYAGEFAAQQQIEVTVDIYDGERLPPAVETTIYRVVQEALVNVAKHAAATSVELRLSCDGSSVDLSVRDDGRGFDTDEPASAHRDHFGVESMRQRVMIVGGEWSLESGRERGTTISVRIPLVTLVAA